MANQKPCDPTETRPSRNPPGKRPRGVFITGNDTGVGKTFVASQIAKALVERGVKVGVYKPVASGCRREAIGLISEDAVSLWEAAGRPKSLREVCPQLFEAPLAPNLAAKAEGREVDSELMLQGAWTWLADFEFTIIEGAGGYFSPLSDQDLCADLAAEFGFPVVLVVANRLGAINQALTAVQAVRTYRSGLPLAGIVLNDVSPQLDSSAEFNLQELRGRADAIPVAPLGFGDSRNVEAILEWLV